MNAYLSIIDDDIDFTNLLKTKLSKWEENILIFNDPMEFIKHYEDHMHYLVILDENMPHIKGTSIADYIKERKPSQNTMILTEDIFHLNLTNHEDSVDVILKKEDCLRHLEFYLKAFHNKYDKDHS